MLKWGERYSPFTGAEREFQGLYDDEYPVRYGYIEKYDNDGDHGFLAYDSYNNFVGDFGTREKAQEALEQYITENMDKFNKRMEREVKEDRRADRR